MDVVLRSEQPQTCLVNPQGFQLPGCAVHIPSSECALLPLAIGWFVKIAVRVASSWSFIFLLLGIDEISLVLVHIFGLLY